MNPAEYADQQAALRKLDELEAECTRRAGTIASLNDRIDDLGRQVAAACKANDSLKRTLDELGCKAGIDGGWVNDRALRAEVERACLRSAVRKVQQWRETGALVEFDVVEQKAWTEAQAPSRDGLDAAALVRGDLMNRLTSWFAQNGNLEVKAQLRAIHRTNALRGHMTPPDEKVAPEGGCTVKCPRCTRVPGFRVEAGQPIGQCAQCWLGEGQHVDLVVVP